MLNSIQSPLSGIRSPFGGIKNPFAIYNIGGQTPQTIADFEADKYRADGTTSTAASLLTHTRAGTATYTDSTGTLQTAASGELRKDNHIWNGSAWVKRCLVEPQSTNLAEDSNEFDTANWTLFDASDTLTANAAESPDGNANAWLFAPSSNSNTHVLRNPHIFSASVTYTISAFIKASGRRYCHVAFGGASLGLPSYEYRRGVFDLQGGVVNAPPTDGVAIIEDFRNGWYRCSVTITPLAAQPANFDIYNADTTDPTSNIVSDGNGVDGILIYGAQLEQSSVPTSYIPTSGSTVTRAADALSIDSTLLPYDSTAMTIAMDYNITGDDGTLFNWEADANNKITANASGGAYTFTQVAAGTSDSVTGGSLADGTNTAASVASRHTDGDINAAIDGTALTVNSTVTALADLSASDFDIAPSTAINIKTIRILGGYGATDAELEAATS